MCSTELFILYLCVCVCVCVVRCVYVCMCVRTHLHMPVGNSCAHKCTHTLQECASIRTLDAHSDDAPSLHINTINMMNARSAALGVLNPRDYRHIVSPISVQYTTARLLANRSGPLHYIKLSMD